MRAATAARSRSRFHLDGKQWWLRLATNLPPPRPSAAKRLFATHTSGVHGDRQRQSVANDVATAQHQRDWSQTDTTYGRHLLPAPSQPTAQGGTPGPAFLNPPGEIAHCRPILASLIPNAHSRMSSRQAYILSSDLARWLLAEGSNLEPPKRIDAQQAREFIQALEALEQHDSHKTHHLAITEGSAPPAVPTPHHILSALCNLPVSELGNYCRSIGSQDGQASLDCCRILIVHFEEEVESAVKVPALETAGRGPENASQRRQIALQGLLYGLAERNAQMGDQVESTSQVRPHQAFFPLRAGIESLIPPSLLLRIHNLSCEDEPRAANGEEQPIYHHLPPDLCYTLASLISISQRPQLFSVFYHLMQQVKSHPNFWSACLSDPRELSFMLQYCTHSSSWREQGGAQLAQDMFRLLLSRPSFAQILGEVEDEAKAYMPQETRRPAMIHLFAHLLQLRYAITAHLPWQAVRACQSTLDDFGWTSEDSRTPTLIWRTCDGLIGEGKPSQTYRRFTTRSSVLPQVRHLLVKHADILARSPLSYQRGEALERLCLYALHVHQPSTALFVLLSFTRAGAQLAHLVTPQTFVDLLLAIPSAAVRSTAPILGQLAGIKKGDSLPREGLFRDAPAPLRSSMVNALCRSRLKQSAAALFLYWAQQGSTHVAAVASDSGIVATLVKHFATRNAGHARKADPIIADDTAVLARKAPPSSPRESDDFCLELVSAFRRHRSLQQCEHRDLTSLASAYFHMNRYEEGFAVFNRLLRTQQVPSAEDLTVLIRALAVSHVEKAVSLYCKYFLEQGRTDMALQPAEQEHSAAPPPLRFTQDLRGDYAILYLLLDRCFQTGEAIPQILRATRYRLFDESVPEGCSLALLVPILDAAWNGCDAETGRGAYCDWPGIAEKMKSAQTTTESRWHVPRSVAMTLCEAAVNGLNVKQLILRKQERAEYIKRRRLYAAEADSHKYKYRSTKSTSPFFSDPHKPMSDEAFAAALRVVFVMDKCTAAASMPIVEMFLRRAYTRAGMDDKSIGVSDPATVTTSSREHISLLNAIVTVVRRMETRVAGVPDDAVGMVEANNEEEGEQTEGTPRPLASTSQTVMNPILFRSLIRLYLRWGDVQGASEVFLWMKEWFAAGCFQSGRSRAPITGRKAVRLGLGPKFPQEHLRPILGDLRMLENDQVPSWTFDGNKIEKTKRWWTAGIRKK